ncbi:MAG: hypothetical protein HOE12_21340 [Gammaproteobacteria bacterium]|nr:hypothetical protein [Gammaproteobacteria bacterium]
MRLLRIIFYFILLLVIVYFGMVFYVDMQLAKKDFSDSYNGCHKVWTARGLYGNGIDQNSIESIGAAFDIGAEGVEVDVRYDKKMQDFIVSHDYPYNKKNGKILKLSELFDALGDNHYFWLDYKKLRHLNEEQTQQAIQRLFEISKKNNLKDRIYIENEAPVNLLKYRKAGLHTIFDTSPVPESMSFVSALMVNLYKMFFYFGDHSVMAMNYGELDDPIYGEHTRERLKNVPVFLYHLPVDETLVNELLALKNVRAFIVGNNQSINFHNKNSCENNS